jgi:hypothetical protein
MKMKRKTMFCMLSLCLLSAANVNAQVTIGGNTDAATGALLDLNSPGGTRGGLVLSNIAITDLSEIPANELWGISSAQGENEDLRGIMVYNTGTPGVPAGIYVWNGYCWSPDGSCTPIFTTPSIRAFAVSAVEHADLEVTADGCPELTYTWYKSAEAFTTGGTPINNSNLMTFRTPTGLTEGIHYYYCTVKSDYSNVVATSDLFTVTVCLPPAQPSTITGSTSVTSGTSQIYSVATVNGATSYEWTLPSGWSGSGTDRSITVTAGTAGGSISVKAINSCGSSDAQTLMVTVTSACPGYTITNGAYSGPATTTMDGDNRISMSRLTGSYNFKVSGNLCLAKNDQGSPSQYNWANANTQCSNLGDGWRLPNIAELGHLQGSQTSYGMAQDVYYSSTDRDGIYAWAWRYILSYAVYNRKAYNPDYNFFTYYVRCVKSLNL